MVTNDTTETGFLFGISDDIEADELAHPINDLFSLIDPDQYIGDLLELNYDHADILVHDSHKIRVDGIPHGCLLLASRVTLKQFESNGYAQNDAALLLLRVAGSVKLNSDINLDQTRFDTVQRSHDTDQNYDDARQTDQFTLNLLRYSGVRCRILGTFRVPRTAGQQPSRLHFGADIGNFYAGQGMKIYKLNDQALQRVVNFHDRSLGNRSKTQIGQLRYSAAINETDTAESVPILISAEDFIAQRTALFGMTRTGKSNATKTIASALFNLRQPANGIRVGQLIFDPNGEYANDNPQDQGCIRNLKYLDDRFSDDIHTYGLYKHPYDEDRHITKFNFYGGREPFSPPSQQELDSILQTLYQGKQIINDALAEETGGYITAFRSANVQPETHISERSEYIRFRRRLFIYRGILASVGFIPQGTADARGLFNASLRDLMRDAPTMQQYVDSLESGTMPWDVVGNFTEAFALWVTESSFKVFDRNHASSNDGRNWSDADLLGLLRFFDNTRARAVTQTTRDWHDLGSTADYAETIVEQVRDGKLVIVDQLLGNPEMNAQAAQRIVSRLFEAQQRSFSHPEEDPGTGEIIDPPPVIIYVEEAHNLLPRANEDDTTKIWTRLAKEGAKFNIGMVYSTQEPSSIQTNILKNTENWFIAHLNNTDETNQIRKFNDFDDFTNSIVNVAEPGFLKIRTRSSYFTVPVQMNLFRAPPAPATTRARTTVSSAADNQQALPV